MPIIKERSIQDLKQRVNIHDVVARVVSLKKAGARFKGLCPFHQEKTPSFHVSPEKGFYKCFGCGKAGDIFTFVMETEGLPFTEAAEALAQRFAVPIEYDEGAGPSLAERSLRQELFDLHELAADFYRQAFLAPTPNGERIRQYWTQQRRFGLDLADEFRIGLAPADDSSLAALFLKRRFSDEALRQCGLFFVREGAVLTLGSLRPRFRGRLMIPIRDHQGRVVAFTARQLEFTPADDPAREAKYVNSPETPIFTKGHLLFNLDRARSHVGEGRPFVLVEGQIDAMRCWSVGLKTAIAPQGTSITDGQLVLLRRYHPQVECFFDSDSAGQNAALRFLPMALRAGLEVRFLKLAGAEKLDPDLLFLERGLAAYEELRRIALSAMDFACRTLLPAPETASAEAKSRAAQTVFEIIRAAESEVTRSEFIAEAARHLRLPVAALQRDFQTASAAIARGQRFPDRPNSPSPPPSPVEAPGKPTEEHLLFLCLHHEELLAGIATRIPANWIDSTTLSGRLLRRFLAEFREHNWPGREHIDQLLENQEEKTLVASLLFDPPNLDDPLKAANEGLRALQRRNIEPLLRQLELEIAHKGTNSDADILLLLKQRTELKQQLLHPPRLSQAV
ncbi:MAG: DNA primase [Opitutaceae bacterium]|nr:DNA primase [Opitutaceae bacterium]